MERGHDQLIRPIEIIHQVGVIFENGVIHQMGVIPEIGVIEHVGVIPQNVVIADNGDAELMEIIPDEKTIQLDAVTEYFDIFTEPG